MENDQAVYEKANFKVFHIEDGSAVISKNGDRLWYKHGKLHRDYGPAIILINGANFGFEFWFKDGVEILCVQNENKVKK